MSININDLFSNNSILVKYKGTWSPSSNILPSIGLWPVGTRLRADSSATISGIYYKENSFLFNDNGTWILENSYDYSDLVNKPALGSAASLNASTSGSLFITLDNTNLTQKNTARQNLGFTSLTSSLALATNKTEFYSTLGLDIDLNSKEDKTNKVQNLSSPLSTSYISTLGLTTYFNAPTFGTVTATSVTANFIGSLTGNSDTATALSTARTISISGDLSYTSGSFNGTSNVTGVATLANSGVTAGTYNNSTTQHSSITVDAKGRITSFGALTTITPAFSSITSKPTTILGYGITDAQTLDATLTSLSSVSKVSTGLIKLINGVASLDSNSYLTANQTITVSGDATGSGTNSLALTLSNSGVVSGTYNNTATQHSSITVDAKGRITSVGAFVTITPAFSSITSLPTTLSGYGITDAQSLISAGTTSQYWRGDKTFQTLDKNAVGLNLVDNTSDANKPVSTAAQTALNLKINSSLIGAASGITPLGADGKVSATYLPASGSYSGSWNASTNSPAIVSSTGSNGQFYIVSVAGTTTIDTINSWAVGDQIRFNGTVWQKIPNTNAVTSVAGKLGAVTLVPSDVGVNIGTNVQAYDTKLNSFAGLGNASTGLLKITNGVASYDSSVYLTSITSGNVTTALGFTPYNSTNPNGYTNNVGTVTNFVFTNGSGFTGTVSTGTSVPTLSLTLQNASSTLSGQLSNTDWNTFNNKLSANQTITISGDASGSGSTSIALTLPNIATAGTYKSLTINAKGQVTGGTNPTTLSGYGITDAQSLNSNLTSLAGLSTVTTGLIKLTNGVASLDSTAYTANLGTVTSFSIVNANGFSGTVATNSTTPSLTLTTSITGLLKGNGTAISAATAGTDYLAPTGSGTSLSGVELLTNKDNSNGYAGLTLNKINFKNVANTFTSFFTNTNTAARTYTFQDRNGTLADDTDLATKQSTLVSGTNIKTINGNNILGSGDLVISGGGSYLPLAGGTLTGNLVFSGIGLRIQGDFSNGTVASRTAFQTSTSNANTSVPFIPNGSATASGIVLFNSSDTANASFLSIYNSSSESAISSTKVGTGTYLPLNFYANNTLSMSLQTNGNLLLGNIADNGNRLRIDGTINSAQTNAGGILTNLHLVNGSTSTGSAVRISLDAGGNGVNVRDAQIIATNNGGNQIALSFAVSAANTPFEALKINYTGNLLLGTSTDSGYKFDMTGAARINAASGQASLYFSQAGTINGRVYAGGGGGTDIIVESLRFVQLTATNEIRLNTNGTQKASILSNGNFLLGTTTDNGSLLQVNGQATIQNNLQCYGGNIYLDSGNCLIRLNDTSSPFTGCSTNIEFWSGQGLGGSQRGNFGFIGGTNLVLYAYGASDNIVIKSSSGQSSVEGGNGYFETSNDGIGVAGKTAKSGLTLFNLARSNGSHLYHTWSDDSLTLDRLGTNVLTATASSNNLFTPSGNIALNITNTSSNLFLSGNPVLIAGSSQLQLFRGDGGAPALTSNSSGTTLSNANGSALLSSTTTTSTLYSGSGAQALSIDSAGSVTTQNKFYAQYPLIQNSGITVKSSSLGSCIDIMLYGTFGTTANQASDIEIPNVDLFGSLVVTVTSDIASTVAGVIEQAYSLGLNAGSNSSANVGTTLKAYGTILSYVTLGSLQWSSAKSKWIIPVSHLNTATTRVIIKLSFQTNTAINNLVNTPPILSAPYTLASLPPYGGTPTNYLDGVFRNWNRIESNYNIAALAGSTGQSNDLIAGAYNFYTTPTYSGTALRYYGTTYAGNWAAGVPYAGSGMLMFQNENNGIITSNGAPIWIGASSQPTIYLPNNASRVGINQPNPICTLDISGDFRTDGSIYFNSINGNTANLSTSIELGNTTGASTPFIDFHSGATGTDYDARIIASGGNGSTGNGSLTIWAGGGLAISNNVSCGGIYYGNGSGLTGLTYGQLSWTPVQQGGGTGQGTNKVYMGWSSDGLKVTIDATDQGALVFKNAPSQKFQDLGTVNGTVTINKNLGTHIIATVNGNTTWNLPSPNTTSEVEAYTIELTGGGNYTMTWPAGSKYVGGIAPLVLSTTGIDVIVITKAGTNAYEIGVSRKQVA